MYSVYILSGPKNHLYVGSTANKEKRVERYRKGMGAEFASRNKTYKLIYSEEFSTFVEARRREKTDQRLA